MGRSEAVLQAVGAPSILRHVPTDGAYGLGRWIGGVEVAMRSHRIRDLRVDHSRFDDHPLVGNIDFEDAIHAREADDNAALSRQRPTTEPGPCSTRDKRNPVLVADANDRLHLLGAARKDNGTGHGAHVGKPIALVGLKLIGSSDQATRQGGIPCIHHRAQRIQNGRIQHRES